jgi:hypothetical protein
MSIPNIEEKALRAYKGTNSSKPAMPTSPNIGQGSVVDSGVSAATLPTRAVGAIVKPITSQYDDLVNMKNRADTLLSDAGKLLPDIKQGLNKLKDVENTVNNARSFFGDSGHRLWAIPAGAGVMLLLYNLMTKDKSPGGYLAHATLGALLGALGSSKGLHNYVSKYYKTLTENNSKPTSVNPPGKV